MVYKMSRHSAILAKFWHILSSRAYLCIPFCSSSVLPIVYIPQVCRAGASCSKRLITLPLFTWCCWIKIHLKNRTSW
ncbi:unnamed protein product [Blepharisma stoltei]|uniref:Secreted protein n=1 Tax=Blepharisma stoltei TaxID=1481888 RepID=A0AAU9J9Q9_9CILI|nr:unnamed protein product [Blepharisma stoltei]